MKCVYIEQSSFHYQMLFIKLGFTTVSDPDRADLICFTGGADVSPYLYGDKQHELTGNNAVRDEKEKRLFEAAQKNGTPCVGICRGGQFLNVMSGGRMYQHVEKHMNSHYLTDHETGEVVYISSTHHQMMLPGNGAQIVATSNLNGKREWFDGVVAKKDVADEDYEVVFYPHTQSLCFQPHPEFTGEDYEPMAQYFKRLIQRLLKV